MALPHPALAVAAAALVGGGSLVATLERDHGVPERAAVAYIAAARGAPCPLDYRILVAIHAVESGHGTSGGSSVAADGKLTKPIGSSAGAQGASQFMPATWARYATDGDGDGVADINDIDDSAASAAALLCASNVDEDLTEAVGSYNGGGNWRRYGESQNYVVAVDERMAALPPDDGSANPRLTGGQSGVASLPDDEGRICGVGEWLSDQGDCVDEAKAKAAYLWARFGQLLDEGDTPKLHAVWAKLNGAPGEAPATNHPISASAGTGLKGDLPGLPGSAGLQEDFAKRLAELVRHAPGEVTITSGYRTTAEQVAIIESHGGECGYMVACVVDGVCLSMHCKGLAVDLEFEDGLTDQWVHANLARYKLCQPMDYEPWHQQPAETC